MAQTTEHQVNVTVTPITLTEFTEDVDVIQKLDDEPNDVGGLTAAELKEEFDKNGNSIKTFINETLIPEVIGADATEQARQEAENERVANELERVSNENTRIANETARSVFETFDSTKAYAIGNKVAYNGSSYRCKAATTAGTLPTDTTYWTLIAQKGNTGETGAKGDTGEKGDTGNAAGFGTPTATAYQLSAGSNPTVSITASGTSESKVFSFEFGIPKGQDGQGTGDMQKSVYDTNNKNQDIFDYADGIVYIGSTQPSGAKIWIDTSD